MGRRKRVILRGYNDIDGINVGCEYTLSLSRIYKMGISLEGLKVKYRYIKGANPACNYFLYDTETGDVILKNTACFKISTMSSVGISFMFIDLDGVPNKTFYFSTNGVENLIKSKCIKHRKYGD